MITEDDALDRILASVAPLTPESVPITEALARFSAGDVLSPADLPRFDQSAMDGYAVRAADARPSAVLHVTGEQPAGLDHGLKVGAGAAVRVFTGAPIPAGADAVIMQEDVERNGDAITIGAEVSPGEFIRRHGDDLCEGQRVIHPGDAVTPARIALLATLGIEALSVHRKPRIAIIGCGNELREPGEPLSPGEIHESNTRMLEALFELHHFEVSSRTTTSDNPAAVSTAIDAAARQDVIVFSGGVSVGDYDPIPAVLKARGVAIDFCRVAVKPGRPFLFGQDKSTFVFGLPGNPVSTFVTAVLFVLPALRRLAGSSVEQARPRTVAARLGAPAENPGERPHYLRGVLTHGTFLPAGLQESHALAALSRANALAKLAPNTRLGPGEIVAAIPLES